MIHIILAIIYLSFVSLGLPDGLLGSGWPAMHLQFGVPVSYAGIVSAIIAVGTVVSSLASDRLTHRLGTGKVTAASVAMTAAALLGFSFSGSFGMLCLWAVPYGLGAGSIDACLNNYVAVNYASRHMSWLHCMWAIGAAAGPYIMGFVLTKGMMWNVGYRTVGVVQLVLAVMLFFALPLWKKGTQNSAAYDAAKDTAPLKLADVVKIKGAKHIMLTFFCFCAVEQTALVWSASYFALGCGMAEEKAAFLGAMFITGEMLGRFLSGFLTYKLNDVQMIRLGQGLIVLGAVIMLLPFDGAAVAGLLIAGLGVAPIYPCLLHMTPANFGEDKSQAVMGIQMASAYVGTCLAPPLFGVIAQNTTMLLLPLFMLLGTVVMWLSHEKVVKR